eukprot:TRINITY_DN11699_c0_g2_i1.p1 TRINITY_DN11699_c0_g2~~TRINITY_DN11699_c0_g2_i1.p1  ORF type:complete len:435 (+),score=153.41 TRINITY_DN11699_c0_g2_i1:48-1307(+)
MSQSFSDLSLDGLNSSSSLHASALVGDGSFSVDEEMEGISGADGSSLDFGFRSPQGTPAHKNNQENAPRRGFFVVDENEAGKEGSEQDIFVPSANSFQSELISAFQHLSDRGLRHSAKWIAELLQSVETTGSDSYGDLIGDLDVRLKMVDQRSDMTKYPAKETRDYLLAKSLFDLKEYQRCSSYLQNATSSRSRFLYRYSRFLSGEKRKEEEQFEVQGQTTVENQELQPLKEELEKMHSEGDLDPFEMYLYGLVLKELDQHNESRQLLAESCSQYPWNWSAWTALSSLCLEISHLSAVTRHFKQLDLALEEKRKRSPSSKIAPISSFFITKIFEASTMISLYHNDMATEILRALMNKSKVLADSMTVTSLYSNCLYNSRQLAEAEEIFEQIRKRDPFRLDDLDVYSNILYVNENRGKLS